MIEIQIILIVMGIAILYMLRKLLTALQEISSKIQDVSTMISDVKLYSDEVESPRPLLPNLENLRDDVGSILENLYRIMHKYNIEPWMPNNDTPLRNERENKKISK